MVGFCSVVVTALEMVGVFDVVVGVDVVFTGVGVGRVRGRLVGAGAGAGAGLGVDVFCSVVVLALALSLDNVVMGGFVGALFVDVDVVVGFVRGANLMDGLDESPFRVIVSVGLFCDVDLACDDDVVVVVVVVVFGFFLFNVITVACSFCFFVGGTKPNPVS